MKKNIKNIALSSITIVLLGSHAYAGKIITDAGDPLHPILVENKQYGFGGWNFNNVNVKIVNTSDFNTAIPGSSFNTTTGVYTPMMEGMSFESEINTGGEVRGKLHGKDWPVGEPAGIKIINDDLNVGHGKPFNCIMTTSYQEYQITGDETSGTAYLDAFANGEQPRPTLCSSPFQTHKRFKINLLPSTVEGIALGQYGQPVEITFNLDPTDMNTTNRRYQVLQKINNYTNMRLDGYKIEVLDENGSKNSALTLSLGKGEGLDEDGNPDPTVDIWGVEDVANMSHGLWGPYEKSGGVVRFDNGFFDYKTVYYDANLSDNNHTISYVGPMLGGNYQDLFGNWLPSSWAPTGIFHDDDHNPATDGILTAFLGVAPGYTERTWYKRTVEYDPSAPSVAPVYTWLPATAQDLQDWTGDWYDEDTVEDVLNLGVNYIVNIGTNSAIGSAFTIRITPHVATNQTPPSSYLPNPGEVKGTADFNGDGTEDILWENAKTNKVTIWYMNADSTYSETVIGTVTSDSRIAGVGQFNSAAPTIIANDAADILWENTADGNISVWYMAADGSYTSQIVMHTNSQSIEGVGDFNGDGLSDILYRDKLSQQISIGYTQVDGTIIAQSLYYTNVQWIIVGVGDLNGDSIADILWRHSISQEIAITYMNSDNTYLDQTLYFTNKRWIIESTGDLDNNGIDDILWRNRLTQEIAITYMNGEGTYTDESLYFTSTSWNIESVADLDNNGFSDILWRNNPSSSTSSEIAATYMSAGTPREETIETISK